ncbi:retrovirus-related pol polyprotein from transposon TNT 1-94 [Tanacetum coccineum]
MTSNLKLLCNFVKKYLGIVRFGNDQFAPILGYGDLVQGNITINRVYYVEGLNHNLFSVGQFCDADLEVAFRKSTCFVRDLQGNDLLTVSKSKRSSFKTKAVPSSKGWLNLLYMDLCGPMRVASINGKKYILTLYAYFKEEGIEHQTSTPRTPEQNGIVERRNRTLVEAARTMLSASKLPLFFWAEEIATACYTQNRSIIIPTHEKKGTRTSSVNNSSSPTDNSKQHDTPPTMKIQSSMEPTTPTNVHAQENNDNQVEDTRV